MFNLCADNTKLENLTFLMRLLVFFSLILLLILSVSLPFQK